MYSTSKYSTYVRTYPHVHEVKAARRGAFEWVHSACSTAIVACSSVTFDPPFGTERMFNYDPRIRAGNTKLSKKAFSVANKFSEAQSVKKEVTGKFTKRLGDDAHAPISVLP